MKNKKTIIVIIACVALVLSFTILVSYAYWRVSQTQTGTNTINGACLSIRLEEYYDEDDNLIEGFTLDNAWPVTDEEGQNQEGYRFKVINECEEELVYQVILDSFSVENEINTNYVKVQIDNKAIRRYGKLEDVDEILTGAKASKKLYTGIAPKKENGQNGEVSHTLRQWISEDSHNDDIGKSFSSKIRVQAGQQIVPSTGKPLKVLSKAGTPNATIDNIEVGDLVGYDTEQFYVIGIDGNNVKLLSRYLLNVGDNPNPSGIEGLQYAKLGYTRTDVDDPNSATEYGEDIQLNGLNGRFSGNWGVFKEYGLVDFLSGSNAYWLDYSNNTFLSPYTENSFAYNDQSNVKQYVDGYVNTLTNMGLPVTSGTLPSLEDVSTLCNTDLTTTFFNEDQCPNYLFETSYWLGNIHSYLKIWFVIADNTIDFENFFAHGSEGVRPVINIILN